MWSKSPVMSIKRLYTAPYRQGRRAKSRADTQSQNYERLSSKAIRERSRSAAIQALTLHPLVNSYSIAVKLVDEFIEHNKTIAADGNKNQIKLLNGANFMEKKQGM